MLKNDKVILVQTGRSKNEIESANLNLIDNRIRVIWIYFRRKEVDNQVAL